MIKHSYNICDYNIIIYDTLMNKGQTARNPLLPIFSIINTGFFHIVKKITYLRCYI